MPFLRHLHPVCTALSAAAVVAAGAWGAHWLQQIANAPPIERKPLLLAPMLGVLDSCILLPDTTATELGQRCTRKGGSASALIEATLTPLEPLPSHTPAPYRLGYTLQAPLLQLFRPQGNDWVIDQTRVARLVQTVQDNPRPVVLYLFATHFPVDAPLERALAANPDNLLHTPQGPLPVDSYFGIPTYPWTFVRTDTEITSRRVQATRALLNGLCQLPATDRAKIEGITLLGEVHHLFPDFQGGMGWKPPYVVTDYSPTSVQGFQRYLAQHLDVLLPPELLDAIDPVPFGNHAMQEEQGCFTSRGYLTLSGDEWEHERPRERQTEKSPPSKNGWNRAGRNVPTRARRSPIGKSLRRSDKEVSLCPIMTITKIIPLPPSSPTWASTTRAPL